MAITAWRHANDYERNIEWTRELLEARLPHRAAGCRIADARALRAVLQSWEAARVTAATAITWLSQLDVFTRN